MFFYFITYILELAIYMISNHIDYREYKVISMHHIIYKKYFRTAVSTACPISFSLLIILFGFSKHSTSCIFTIDNHSTWPFDMTLF